MAKKTARRKKIEEPEYRTKGFQHAHDQAGASETVTEFLEEEGMITPKESSRKVRKSAAKKSTKASNSSGGKSKARAKKRTAKTKTPPRRRKGRSPCKSRSFRLPLETDDQLQFLTRYYECYMLDVIKVAIHNEWVRATRERQRRNKASQVVEEASARAGLPEERVPETQAT